LHASSASDTAAKHIPSMEQKPTAATDCLQTQNNHPFKN
jgi:hypothetical protein